MTKLWRSTRQIVRYATPYDFAFTLYISSEQPAGTKISARAWPEGDPTNVVEFHGITNGQTGSNTAYFKQDGSLHSYVSFPGFSEVTRIPAPGGFIATNQAATNIVVEWWTDNDALRSPYNFGDRLDGDNGGGYVASDNSNYTEATPDIVRFSFDYTHDITFGSGSFVNSLTSLPNGVHDAPLGPFKIETHEIGNPSHRAVFSGSITGNYAVNLANKQLFRTWYRGTGAWRSDDHNSGVDWVADDFSNGIDADALAGPVRVVITLPYAFRGSPWGYNQGGASARYCSFDDYTYEVAPFGTPLPPSAPTPVAPTVVDDAVSTDYGVGVTAYPLANDTAGSSPLDPASVELWDGAVYVKNLYRTEGDILVQTDGSVNITPASGYSGTFSFSYRVSGTDGAASSLASVTVTVAAYVAPVEPTPPTAVSDTFNTDYNTGVTVAVLANDTAGTNAIDPASVQVWDGAVWVKTATITGGSVSVNADGTITFVPLDYSGAVSFDYRVAGTSGLYSAPATVSGNVAAYVPPTPPRAVADSFETAHNTPATIYPLANDEAGTNAIDPASVEVWDGAVWANLITVTGGTFEVHATDGSIYFTPALDYSGSVEVLYRIADTSGLFSEATISGVVLAAPTVAPVLSNLTYITEWATPLTFFPLDGQNPGSGSFDISSLVIAGNTFGKSVSLAEGDYTVNLDGSITFTPALNFEGVVPVIQYKAANDAGQVSDPASIALSVSEEPTPPVLPITPLEGVKWALGRFGDGVLDGFEIPYSADSLTLSYDGYDDAELTIPLFALSVSDRLNWRTKFQEGEKACTLLDASDTVVFSGYIEKHDIDPEAETLKLKLKSFKYWLADLFAVHGNTDAIEDPAAVWTLTASPSTVVKNVVVDVLSRPGTPSSIKLPNSKAGTYRLDIPMSELKPVSEVIDQVSQDYAGQEITFRPYKDGNRIIHEMIAGRPHYNDDATTEVVVDLDDPNKIAVSFAQMSDLGDNFNRVWLQSETEGTTLNLKAKTVTGNTRLIREKKEKLAAVLTAEQLEEQYAARLTYANTSARNNTITIWDDNYSFHAAAGRRIRFTGSGKYAGLADVCRLLSVKFTTKGRTSDLTVDNIKRVYPQLPKTAKEDILQSAKELVNDKLAWGGFDSSLGADGGNPWTNPGDGSGGDFSNSDLWGDEGKPSDITPPVTVANGIFSDFAQVVVYPSPSSGRYPIVGQSITQADGNRIYGLDKTFQSVFNSDLNADGFPVNGWDTFYIRTSFLQNGNIGNITNAGQITNLDLGMFLEPYTIPPVGSIGPDGAGIENARRLMITAFSVGGRMYAFIGDTVQYKHTYYGDYTYTQQNSQGLRSQVKLISARLDETGAIASGWVSEYVPANNAFPMATTISKYGTKVLLGAGTVLENGTNPQPALPEQTVTAINFIRDMGNMANLWLNYPFCTFGGSGAQPLYPVAYKGWLYAIQYGGRGSTSGIYRLPLSADGAISPDATWIKCIDLETDNIGLLVVRGYLVYSNKQTTGTCYRKINDNGTLATEQATEGGPANFISRGFHMGDFANNQFPPMYDPLYSNYNSGGTQVAQYSRYFSYGGYVYQLQNVGQTMTGLQITSMRIKEL